MRKPTIYEALEAKLGRTPTNAEVKADVARILDESLVERAGKGKLRHQRRVVSSDARRLCRAFDVQEERESTEIGI